MATRVFCDSSFDEKRNICGIGIYIENGQHHHTIQHTIPATDNNIGEIWAVYIAAILTFGKNATIYTDSVTALSYIKNQQNDTKERTATQERLHRILKTYGAKIRILKPTVEWTKGHRHDFQELAIGNSMADLLAKYGRARYYQQNDIRGKQR